jgi:hypothetical protein
MNCQSVTLPGGGSAIVCGSRRRERCGCGRPATRLCDWKGPAEAVRGTAEQGAPSPLPGTCDKPICVRCTTSPAPDKDLCPAHAAEFEAWKARRA